MKKFLKRILAAAGIFAPLKSFYRRIFPFQTPAWKWPSETSKCRERLASYCTGYGADLGFGGDPIVAHAIRVDLPSPYTSVGAFPVQLGGAAEDLHWFRDGALDFIYSSHLLEDYENTTEVLAEWLRVIKPGGLLLIYCPDEQRFREHCRSTGQPYNSNHKLEHFSLDYVKHCLTKLEELDIVHELPRAEIYSWDLVVRRRGGPSQN